MHCAAALLLAAAPLAAAAEPGLTLHFQDRPPYSRAGAAGGAEGLVATPAAQALAAASVPFDWALTPSRRQLALIEGGSGRHCGVGWFRSPAREAAGKFSQPLYRDRPFGALVRTRLAFDAAPDAAQLLGRHVLLVKDGYSYGEALDAAIAGAAVAPVRTPAEVPQMAQMLRAGRADWMIAAPEEGQVLAGAGLRWVELAGATPGPTRHLYCSRDVPDAWLARIDRALARGAGR